MKHPSFLVIPLLLLIFTSCTDNFETLFNFVNGQELTFEASFGDEPFTKTVVQSDGKSIWWSAHEAINIFYGDSESSKFTSTNDEPVAKAKFTGSIEGFTGETESGEPTSFWAIYPYDEANTCDGTAITATLPGFQTGKAETFSDKQWMTMAKNYGLSLSFYAVGAGFRFSVTKEGVTSVTFKGNNNEVLAGKAKIGMDANNRPVVLEHLTEVKEIILSAPDGESFEVGKLYYLAIYPTNFTKGFTITFNTDTEAGTRVYNNSIDFKRTDVHRGKNFDSGVEYVKVDRMIVSPSAFTLTKSSQIIDIVVKANVDYDVVIPDSCKDWIAKTPTKALNSSTHSFAISQNTDNARQGTITFNQKNGPLSKTVLINQASGYLPQYVPFADENFKEYCLNYFDKNFDLEISISEAEAVNKIDVNTDNISSLSGIEYFTNLSTLSCRGSSYSWTGTEYIGTGKLTALDVSSNVNLTDLDCSNNQLTLLNISHNLQLRRLCCMGNQLITLNLSSCPYLDLKKSSVSSMIGNNDKLSTIIVRKGHADVEINGITIIEMIPDKSMILEYLQSEVMSFLDEIEEQSKYPGMTANDSTKLFYHAVAFAQAREEISYIDPDYAEQEKGLFKYYKGTNAITGEVVIGKIPFYELDMGAFRNKRYDCIVESGNVVEVGGFQNIFSQLFNSEVGNLFYWWDPYGYSGSWAIKKITDRPSVLNAENYKAFCGCFKYVDTPPYVVPL